MHDDATLATTDAAVLTTARALNSLFMEIGESLDRVNAPAYLRIETGYARGQYAIAQVTVTCRPVTLGSAIGYDDLAKPPQWPFMEERRCAASEGRSDHDPLWRLDQAVKAFNAACEAWFAARQGTDAANGLVIYTGHDPEGVAVSLSHVVGIVDPGTVEHERRLARMKDEKP